MDKSPLSDQFCFRANLRRHHRIKFRSGQWVENRYSNIVRLSFANHADGLFNLSPGLARIAKLQKETGAHAMLPQVFAGLVDLPDSVPLDMASRIRCDPDSAPIHTSAQPAWRSALLSHASSSRSAIAF